MGRSPLWQAVHERSARALARGALVPTRTSRQVVEQAGVRFVVRVLAQLDRKAHARAAQSAGAAPRNPFLPYDEDLFVAELSPTHVGLLNKFPVVEDHLLVVTRDFEPQEHLLGLADFAALWVTLGEAGGLAFYNAGRVAGASQPHKHLQVVPTPLDRGPERVPIEPLLARARFPGRVGRIPGLPFAHAFARLEEPTAEAAHTLYRELLHRAGCDAGGRPRAYNLLATREWLLLLPRAREHAGPISVNALGFAGTFYVRSREELTLLQERSPLELLREVGVSD